MRMSDKRTYLSLVGPPDPSHQLDNPSGRNPEDATESWGLLLLAAGTGLLVGLMLGLMTRIDQLAWAWSVMK